MAVCAVALAACGNGVSFEIEFPTQYPDATFYLTPDEQPQNYYAKTQSDSEGIIRFKGRLRQPIVARISDGYAMISPAFFLESGRIKFGLLSKDSPDVVAMGTPSNDANNLFVLTQRAIEQKCAETATDSLEFATTLQQKLDSLYTATLNANTNNIMGVCMLLQNPGMVTNADSLVSILSPEMRKHPYIQDALQQTNSTSNQ